ncbi:MAG: sulfurtransferase [Gammaproteobacteria bacterium]|nr:sulfurtransferase [Gammaproteobacteria bacterium]
MREISPHELQAQFATGRPLILDVREPWEFDVCRIPSSINIPLNGIPMHLAELCRTASLVVVCHHGMRSEYAQRFLVENGFADVANLAGGIDRWARELDPEMTRY